MTSTIATEGATTRTDWLAVARELGPGFASRAAALDANDSFAAENFQELKQHKLLSAGIPAELGGGGATHRELCAMLRELGRHCGSTALTLSMHTHLVTTPVWVWRQGGPTGPMLERVAAEELMLVTCTANDLLESNGSAERVEDGFRVNARKRFVSGAPAGDVFIASAIYEDPYEGSTVIQFSIPMKSEGISIAEDWRTMGMRATGSNDVLLENVFVSDAAVAARRPKGSFPPMFHVVAPIAVPVIMSVYLGIAEAARDLALTSAEKRREDTDTWYLIGEMENAMVTAELAIQSSIDLCDDYNFQPELSRTNAVFVRKAIAGQALLQAVEKALEVAGGAGFFRKLGLERMLRDMHAAHFHPLQGKAQHRFTGRFVLGFDPPMGKQ